MKQATDMYIHLKGLRLYAYHGVLPQENRVGAQYTIDLRLKTDFTLAAETDADVFNAVKEEMRIPSQLLEHVAWRIAQRLLDDFQTISEINIALYKQNPPMGADCSQVGVEATYIR